MITSALLQFPKESCIRFTPKCQCLTKCGGSPKSNAKTFHTIVLYLAPSIIYIIAACISHLVMFKDHSITASEDSTQSTNTSHLVIFVLIAIYCVAPIVYIALSFAYYKVGNNIEAIYNYFHRSLVKSISVVSQLVALYSK